MTDSIDSSELRRPPGVIPEMFTGDYQWTLEKAAQLANIWTKADNIYWTAIKGTPVSKLSPKHCWAVTNRFDPRVIAADKVKIIYIYMEEV
jgi:hypothetical protein